MIPEDGKRTTPQQRAIDKDKKYALARGDRWMVHSPDGRRPYNGNSKEEADAAVQAYLPRLKAGETMVLTDLISEPKTTAQLAIQEHLRNTQRTNTRFLVVNRRSGKKIVATGDELVAREGLLRSPSHECYDLHLIGK